MAGEPILEGITLRIRGLVQGVGFRPHVWRLAHDAGLIGEVRNDGEGVIVHAWGDCKTLDQFCRRIVGEAPRLARIDTIERDILHAPAPRSDFQITASRQGQITTGIVPDAATCPDCLAEIRDSSARRFGYAFTNCTQCGPRLSIVKAIPYDRRRTSMAGFVMCPGCRAEYEDPGDRRFHAQPIACPRCGPSLWLEGGETGDPIAVAVAALRAGRILAIKGIGGFHLSCDAANAAAVAELRRRKRRGDKPFALMVPNFAAAECFAVLADGAGDALSAPSAPIVLLPLRIGGERLPVEIAPGQQTLGVMLPYSPLHHLLMDAFAEPLVMTSGNRAEEPQCIDNESARKSLSGLADLFLMHDRPIINRVDDSVLRIAAGRPRMLRRARGFAPGRFALPPGLRSRRRVLALGADLKNTFCLAADGAATLSQHLGDLSHAAARVEARRALALYRDLYDFRPDDIVVDLHPDHASTQFGEALAEEIGARLIRVQHHHAHIASCLAENRIALEDGPVLGMALDGTGHGTDGTVWGGEFLLGSYGDFRRVGCFTPVPLPGGDQAAREPWRNLYAHLRRRWNRDELQRRYSGIAGLEKLIAKPLDLIDNMIVKRINTPLTSSAGRLFDAVAALLDIVPDRLSFEAEAAQKLEAAASTALVNVGGYPTEIRNQSAIELDCAAMWPALLDDLAAKVPVPVVARRFHNTLVTALIRSAELLGGAHAIRRVALSGGVFHNRLLLEGTITGLESAGFTVLSQSEVPCGDGGIALGQAAIALATV